MVLKVLYIYISQAYQTGSLQAGCGPFDFCWLSTKRFKTNCKYDLKGRIYGGKKKDLI
jgi:hypothetical protein